MGGDFLLNTDVCQFHYNNDADAKVNMISIMCMFTKRGAAEGEAAVWEIEVETRDVFLPV